jgi:hypothetical protein
MPYLRSGAISQMLGLLRKNRSYVTGVEIASVAVASLRTSSIEMTVVS